MARKNVQVSADDVMKRMFPDLPTSDDIPQTKAADPADQTSQTLAALQAKIAQLEGQVATTSRANQALSSQAQTEMPPVRPNINYDAAPDPVADPKGFAQFHAQATQLLVAFERDSVLYAQRQQSKSASRTADLWREFEANHKDHAKDAEKVEIAATRVIERARAKGIDTDKYMYANSPTFMKDVTSEMDRLWPNLVTAGAKAGDDDDEGDDDRTDVFGGGAVSGGQQAVGKAAPQRYGSLSQDVMAWQEKTGFHR